jgi:hypothetical protein
MSSRAGSGDLGTSVSAIRVQKQKAAWQADRTGWVDPYAYRLKKEETA